MGNNVWFRLISSTFHRHCHILVHILVRLFIQSSEVRGIPVAHVSYKKPGPMLTVICNRCKKSSSSQWNTSTSLCYIIDDFLIFNKAFLSKYLRLVLPMQWLDRLNCMLYKCPERSSYFLYTERLNSQVRYTSVAHVSHKKSSMCPLFVVHGRGYHSVTRSVTKLGLCQQPIFN